MCGADVGVGGGGQISKLMKPEKIKRLKLAGLFELSTPPFFFKFAITSATRCSFFFLLKPAVLLRVFAKKNLDFLERRFFCGTVSYESVLISF